MRPSSTPHPEKSEYDSLPGFRGFDYDIRGDNSTMRYNLDLRFLPLRAIQQIQPSHCLDRLGSGEMYEPWRILDLMALAADEESHFISVLLWFHANLASAVRDPKQTHQAQEPWNGVGVRQVVRPG